MTGEMTVVIEMSRVAKDQACSGHRSPRGRMAGVKVTMMANTTGLLETPRVIRTGTAGVREAARDGHSGQAVHGDQQQGSSWFTSDQELG